MSSWNRGMRRAGGLAWWAVAGLLLAALPAAAAEDTDASDMEFLRKAGKAFSGVARRAIPAVVFIEVESTYQVGGYAPGAPLNDPYGLFGDEFLQRFFRGRFGATPPRQYRRTGQGSGFIVSEEGYILTNNHVIGNADKITVRLHDGRIFEAEPVGADPHSEVAVIKIDGQDLPVLPLGDSDDLDIGEWVIAIGNPFGLSETLTVGVVSAKGRSRLGIADYENFIQTDAAINPGNSGGPLLNIQGEAVGINTAIFSRSGGYMGIGFAVPINMARAIRDQLVATGRVDRGHIGIVIQDINQELAASLGMERAEGILIAQVMAGAAGEKAGLRPGDVVLELNGRPVGDVPRFRNDIAALTPGTEIRLKVLREAAAEEVRFTVGSLQTAVTAAAAAAEAAGEDQLGMAVEDLTPERAQRFGYEPGAGVLITRVDEGGPAARAGLEPGLLITGVNRQGVRDVRAFQAALAATRANAVLLLVTDGRIARFIAVAVR